MSDPIFAVVDPFNPDELSSQLQFPTKSVQASERTPLLGNGAQPLKQAVHPRLDHIIPNEDPGMFDPAGQTAYELYRQNNDTLFDINECLERFKPARLARFQEDVIFQKRLDAEKAHADARVKELTIQYAKSLQIEDINIKNARNLRAGTEAAKLQDAINRKQKKINDKLNNISSLNSVDEKISRSTYSSALNQFVELRGNGHPLTDDNGSGDDYACQIYQIHPLNVYANFDIETILHLVKDINPRLEDFFEQERILVENYKPSLIRTIGSFIANIFTLGIASLFIKENSRTFKMVGQQYISEKEFYHRRIAGAVAEYVAIVLGKYHGLPNVISSEDSKILLEFVKKYGNNKNKVGQLPITQKQKFIDHIENGLQALKTQESQFKWYHKWFTNKYQRCLDLQASYSRILKEVQAAKPGYDGKSFAIINDTDSAEQLIKNFNEKQQSEHVVYSEDNAWVIYPNNVGPHKEAIDGLINTEFKVQFREAYNQFFRLNDDNIHLNIDNYLEIKKAFSPTTLLTDSEAVFQNKKKFVRYLVAHTDAKLYNKLTPEEKCPALFNLYCNYGQQGPQGVKKQAALKTLLERLHDFVCQTNEISMADAVTTQLDALARLDPYGPIMNIIFKHGVSGTLPNRLREQDFSDEAILNSTLPVLQRCLKTAIDRAKVLGTSNINQRVLLTLLHFVEGKVNKITANDLALLRQAMPAYRLADVNEYKDGREPDDIIKFLTNKYIVHNFTQMANRKATLTSPAKYIQLCDFIYDHGSHIDLEALSDQGTSYFRQLLLRPYGYEWKVKNDGLDGGVQNLSFLRGVLDDNINQRQLKEGEPAIVDPRDVRLPIQLSEVRQQRLHIVADRKSRHCLSKYLRSYLDGFLNVALDELKAANTADKITDVQVAAVVAAYKQDIEAAQAANEGKSQELTVSLHHTRAFLNRNASQTWAKELTALLDALRQDLRNHDPLYGLKAFDGCDITGQPYKQPDRLALVFLQVADTKTLKKYTKKLFNAIFNKDNVNLDNYPDAKEFLIRVLTHPTQYKEVCDTVLKILNNYTNDKVQTARQYRDKQGEINTVVEEDYKYQYARETEISLLGLLNQTTAQGLPFASAQLSGLATIVQRYRVKAIENILVTEDAVAQARIEEAANYNEVVLPIVKLTRPSVDEGGSDINEVNAQSYFDEHTIDPLKETCAYVDFLYHNPLTTTAIFDPVGQNLIDAAVQTFLSKAATTSACAPKNVDLVLRLASPRWGETILLNKFEALLHNVTKHDEKFVIKAIDDFFAALKKGGVLFKYMSEGAGGTPASLQTKPITYLSENNEFIYCLDPQITSNEGKRRIKALLNDYIQKLAGRSDLENVQDWMPILASVKANQEQYPLDRIERLAEVFADAKTLNKVRSLRVLMQLCNDPASQEALDETTNYTKYIDGNAYIDAKGNIRPIQRDEAKRELFQPWVDGKKNIRPITLDNADREPFEPLCAWYQNTYQRKATPPHTFNKKAVLLFNSFAPVARRELYAAQRAEELFLTDGFVQIKRLLTEQNAKLLASLLGSPYFTQIQRFLTHPNFKHFRILLTAREFSTLQKLLAGDSFGRFKERFINLDLAQMQELFREIDFAQLQTLVNNGDLESVQKLLARDSFRQFKARLISLDLVQMQALFNDIDVAPLQALFNAGELGQAQALLASGNFVQFKEIFTGFDITQIQVLFNKFDFAQLQTLLNNGEFEQVQALLATVNFTSYSELFVRFRLEQLQQLFADIRFEDLKASLTNGDADVGRMNKLLTGANFAEFKKLLADFSFEQMRQLFCDANFGQVKQLIMGYSDEQFELLHINAKQLSKNNYFDQAEEYVNQLRRQRGRGRMVPAAIPSDRRKAAGIIDNEPLSNLKALATTTAAQEKLEQIFKQHEDEVAHGRRPIYSPVATMLVGEFGLRNKMRHMFMDRLEQLLTHGDVTDPHMLPLGFTQALPAGVINKWAYWQRSQQYRPGSPDYRFEMDEKALFDEWNADKIGDLFINRANDYLALAGEASDKARDEHIAAMKRLKAILNRGFAALKERVKELSKLEIHKDLFLEQTDLTLLEKKRAWVDQNVKLIRNIFDKFHANPLIARAASEEEKHGKDEFLWNEWVTFRDIWDDANKIIEEQSTYRSKLTPANLGKTILDFKADLRHITEAAIKEDNQERTKELRQQLRRKQEAVIDVMKSYIGYTYDPIYQALPLLADIMLCEDPSIFLSFLDMLKIRFAEVEQVVAVIALLESKTGFKNRVNHIATYFQKVYDDFKMPYSIASNGPSIVSLADIFNHDGWKPPYDPDQAIWIAEKIKTSPELYLNSERQVAQDKQENPHPVYNYLKKHFLEEFITPHFAGNSETYSIWSYQTVAQDLLGNFAKVCEQAQRFNHILANISRQKTHYIPLRLTLPLHEVLGNEDELQAFLDSLDNNNKQKYLQQIDMLQASLHERKEMGSFLSRQLYRLRELISSPAGLYVILNGISQQVFDLFASEPALQADNVALYDCVQKLQHSLKATVLSPDKFMQAFFDFHEDVKQSPLASRQFAALNKAFADSKPSPEMEKQYIVFSTFVTQGPATGLKGYRDELAQEWESLRGFAQDYDETAQELLSYVKELAKGKLGDANVLSVEQVLQNKAQQFIDRVPTPLASYRSSFQVALEKLSKRPDLADKYNELKAILTRLDPDLTNAQLQKANLDRAQLLEKQKQDSIQIAYHLNLYMGLLKKINEKQFIAAQEIITVTDAGQQTPSPVAVARAEQLFKSAQTLLEGKGKKGLRFEQLIDLRYLFIWALQQAPELANALREAIVTAAMTRLAEIIAAPRADSIFITNEEYAALQELETQGLPIIQEIQQDVIAQLQAQLQLIEAQQVDDNVLLHLKALGPVVQYWGTSELQTSYENIASFEARAKAAELTKGKVDALNGILTILADGSKLSDFAVLNAHITYLVKHATDAEKATAVSILRENMAYHYHWYLQAKTFDKDTNSFIPYHISQSIIDRLAGKVLSEDMLALKVEFLIENFNSIDTHYAILTAEGKVQKVSAKNDKVLDDELKSRNPDTRTKAEDYRAFVVKLAQRLLTDYFRVVVYGSQQQVKEVEEAIAVYINTYVGAKAKKTSYTPAHNATVIAQFIYRWGNDADLTVCANKSNRIPKAIHIIRQEFGGYKHTRPMPSDRNWGIKRVVSSHNSVVSLTTTSQSVGAGGSGAQDIIGANPHPMRAQSVPIIMNAYGSSPQATPATYFAHHTTGTMQTEVDSASASSSSSSASSSRSASPQPESWPAGYDEVVQQSQQGQAGAADTEGSASSQPNPWAARHEMMQQQGQDLAAIAGMSSQDTAIVPPPVSAQPGVVGVPNMYQLLAQMYSSSASSTSYPQGASLGSHSQQDVRKLPVDPSVVSGSDDDPSRFNAGI